MDLPNIRHLVNPINYLRKGGIFSRKVGYLLLHVSRIHSVFIRLILAKLFFRLDEQEKLFLQELRNNGYVVIKRNKLINVDDLLEEADSILRAHPIEKDSPINHKKSYLIPLIEQAHLALTSPFMQIALSRELVSLVSAYFNTLPILTYLNVWLSPAFSSKGKGSSQLWHLDHESFTQIKVFVYIRDVGEHSGPTTIFSKADSKAIQEKINYQIKNDEKHFDYDSAEFTEIPLLGKRGDIVLIDTGSCIHRGAADILEERILLTIQYLPICAFSRNKFSSFRRQSFLASTYTEQKLLTR
jgi:hypothetical protein